MDTAIRHSSPDLSEHAYPAKHSAVHVQDRISDTEPCCIHGWPKERSTKVDRPHRPHRPTDPPTHQPWAGFTASTPGNAHWVVKGRTTNEARRKPGGTVQYTVQDLSSASKVEILPGVRDPICVSTVTLLCSLDASLSVNKPRCPVRPFKSMHRVQSSRSPVAVQYGMLIDSV